LWPFIVCYSPSSTNFLSFLHENANGIWEKFTAANPNTSGLKLLQVHGWSTETDLIKILRSLPALETLIIRHLGDSEVTLNDDFFRAFVPLDASGTPGLRESSRKGQISTAVCPMLKNLWIEGVEITEQPELMPILREIVMLHTPALESLNFCWDLEHPPSKEVGLIGKDGVFTMGEVVNGPDYGFRLEI
jgi:hypothetical protein